MNVSVSRENHEDFRVLTTMGHASHTGHVTRTASTESGSVIDVRRLRFIKSLRPANEAWEIRHDDALRLLPQLPYRGEELARPERRGNGAAAGASFCRLGVCDGRIGKLLGIRPRETNSHKVRVHLARAPDQRGRSCQRSPKNERTAKLPVRQVN
jgi:hypothetical protein